MRCALFVGVGLLIGLVVVPESADAFGSEFEVRLLSPSTLAYKSVHVYDSQDAKVPRGAMDASGDGDVSPKEAIEYAAELEEHILNQVEQGGVLSDIKIDNTTSTRLQYTEFRHWGAVGAVESGPEIILVVAATAWFDKVGPSPIHNLTVSVPPLSSFAANHVLSVAMPRIYQDVQFSPSTASATVTRDWTFFHSTFSERSDFWLTFASPQKVPADSPVPAWETLFGFAATIGLYRKQRGGRPT